MKDYKLWKLFYLGNVRIGQKYLIREFESQKLFPLVSGNCMTEAPSD